MRRARAESTCVCIEHVAVVRRVVKAGRSEVEAGTIRFLQTQSYPVQASGDGAAFEPGEEFVAFLVWDDRLQVFLTSNSRSTYMPVRDGRVRFIRGDVPGLRDSMPVDEFIAVIARMLRVG